MAGVGTEGRGAACVLKDSEKGVSFGEVERRLEKPRRRVGGCVGDGVFSWESVLAPEEYAEIELMPELTGIMRYGCQHNGSKISTFGGESTNNYLLP